MRELLKITGYVVCVMLGGALLAPLLWWLGHWAIDINLLPGLRPFAFDKYFNRAALVLAIGLLPWLVRSLRVESLQALGLVQNPAWARDLALGLGIAVSGFGLVVSALVLSGALQLQQGGSPQAWVLAALAAAGAGVVEELLFRGVFFGVLRRTMHRYTALVTLSLLFAGLHFLRPNPAIPQPARVTWLSGLQLLPHLLWEYAQPQRLVASGLTLTAMALILGYTVMKTRSLYFAIGLHAGWVFCVKAVSLTAVPASRQDFWLGSDFRSGLAPLLLMMLTGLVVVMVLRESGASAKAGPKVYCRTGDA